MALDERFRSLKVNYALIVLASIAWSSSGVFFRWVGLEGQEQVAVFWRTIFSLLFFAAVILVRKDFKHFSPGRSPLLLLAGLVSGAFGLFYFKALNHLSIGEATFIMYLAPVFIALSAPLVFREKLERTTFLCLALGIGGTLLLAFSNAGKAGPLISVGIMFAILCAIFYAALVILLKKLREKLSSATIGFWLAVITGIVFLPFAVAETYTLSTKGWVGLAILGVFHLGVVGLVYLYALLRVKAQHAGILTYLEPVSAMVFGFIFLSETPRWPDLLGALLIIVAGAIVFGERQVRSASGRTTPSDSRQ